MPWEEEKEHRTNSPLLITDSPTSYNDPTGKPIWRNRVKRQPTISFISSLALPKYSPHTKHCIKSLTSEDDGNNLGEVGSAPKKRIGNHEDISVARANYNIRRRLDDDGKYEGSSKLDENSSNATPTKVKPQTYRQNNTTPRTPLVEVDDTSPNESTTSTKLDFDEELNDDDELNKKVAAEKEVVGNDIVGGVAAAAVVASGGGVNLFGKDKEGLDDSFSSKQDEFRGVNDATAAASEGGAAAASVVVDKSPSDGGVVTNQEAEALVAQALLSMANEAFVSRASDANPAIAPPVSKIPRLGKSRCAPKNDGDKILNITPTIIAEETDIEPQWRHLTLAGMSDNAVQSKYGYESQYRFSGDKPQERKLKRMIYQLKKENEDMKNFLEKGHIKPLDILSKSKTAHCGCCNGSFLVSLSDGHYDYKAMRSHILGRLHRSGRVPGIPIGGCIAGKAGRNKPDKNVLIFALWRSLNLNRSCIPSTGTFDCGAHGHPELGKVTLDSIRSFVTIATGNKKNGAKKVVTGQIAEDLRPLVQGMNYCPEEWKTPLSDDELRFNRTKRQEYIRKWDALETPDQLKEACEDLKSDGEKVGVSKTNGAEMRRRLMRWLNKKYPEPNDD